ncbi:Heterokaryon incompatibility protein 6, OR allele [Madurella mycetomatis]|uniref:Heterokaryon incompatibility protein 6, OR allele n=1 Tax=Madurella mycetomatis TaxID=100816 RepID=A0A175WGM2_9PEZI|nr:Heterokaryon incompatibility protein 6, OR allele [Madurella mycetomatis]KXX82988.1 Heterokaryon incompatibility protein 6, OR allele [Madurella mycetomatis]
MATPIQTYPYKPLNPAGRAIRIDGSPVSVTANLETALSYLWHDPEVGQHRTLWVDAICINQADLTEKASQIRMMYEIYASAASVLAWTGEASETDNIAEAFQAAIDLKKAVRSQYAFSQGSLGVRAQILQTVCLWLTMVTPSLAGLLDHLPKNLFAIADDGDVVHSSWLASNLHSFDRYLREDGSVVPGINMLVASIPKAMELHPQMLILSLASKFAATEPRDKVYALLGLFGDDYKSFPIDYCEDVETIYQTLTYTMISKQQNLRILNGNRSHPSWQRMQASWTLDPYQVSIENPDGFPEDSLYRTGGKELPIATWDKLAKTLTVRGLRLTRLKRVEGPFKPNLHSILKLTNDIFPSLHTDPNLFERAWKTALRVTGGLRSDKFAVTDFFADDTPNYSAIASHFWSPNPSPALEAFYSTLLDDSSIINDEAIQTVLSSPLSSTSKIPLPINPTTKQYIPKGTAREFLARLAKSLAYRCFCIAESGDYCILGPYGSRPEDVIAVFVGEKKPYVLRERDGTSGRFELVGDAFVEGVMAGELFDAESGQAG